MGDVISQGCILASTAISKAATWMQASPSPTTSITPRSFTQPHTNCLQTIVHPLIVHGEGAWVKHKVIVYVRVGNLWQNFHTVHNSTFGESNPYNYQWQFLTVSSKMRSIQAAVTALFDVFEAISECSDAWWCQWKPSIIVFQYNQYFDDCVYYQLTTSALDFLLTCSVIRGCLWKLWEMTCKNDFSAWFPPLVYNTQQNLVG